MKLKKLIVFLKWTNLLLVGVTLFSYLSPLLSPTQFWPASFLGLFYPWFLLLHFLFIFFWVLKKHYYCFFSAVCIIVGWNHFTNFVGLPFRTVEPISEKDIKVMTFNCFSLVDRHNDHKFLEKEAFLSFISPHEPDVLLLQEFVNRSKIQSYIDFIAKKTALKYHAWSSKGRLVILSKYPLENASSTFFKNNSNGFQQADLILEDTKIRLFNIHLQTNAISNIADKVASEGDIKEKETWLDIKGMMGRYRRSARLRAHQSEKVAEKIRASPHPVIVAGDFNDTPMSFSYHHLSQNLKDSFREKGRGLGTTYAGSIPALRIDYILSDPRFQILEHRIIKKSFSDHYPVMGRVRIE